MNKLIIFDVDGVLNKEEKILKERYNAQIKAIMDKYKIPKKEAIKKREKAKQMLSNKKKHTSVYIFMKIGFSRKKYFKVIDGVDVKGKISINKNCRKTLNKLKKHKIIAYSNTPKKSTIKTLNLLKIKKYFRKIYSTEDFPESKPSKANLIKILKQLKFKPKDSILIGNSLEKDILPAKKLGIKTILFDKKRKSAKGADYVIKDLIEITKLV